MLIGLRGAGKTTVARLLGETLSRPHYDTDALIEAESGRTIRDWFESSGEAEFRRVESDILRRLLERSGQIISVGGGAVLTEENRVRMKSAAWCVWLRAQPGALQRRLLADPRTPLTRPALTGLPLPDELRLLAEQRDPLYAALADHVVDTDDRDSAQIAAHLAELIRKLPD